MVKEGFPLENGKKTIKKHDDEGVDGRDKARSINTMPFLSGTYILQKSKTILNVVFNQIGGFYTNNIYYEDIDSTYSHEKYWSCFFDNSLLAEDLGLVRTDCGNSDVFYAWFLAPIIEYYLVKIILVFFWLTQPSKVIAKKIG